MSALPPIAAAAIGGRRVRFGPIADMAPRHDLLRFGCAGTGSGNALVALNLAAVHYAPRLGIKRVTAV